MNQDAEKIQTNADEANVWVLLEQIKTGWRWLAGGAILGLAGAISFVLITPAQYEATAVIQPATLGVPAIAPSVSTNTSTTSPTATAKGVDVESAAQTLERLKTPSFYTEVLLQACEVKTQANPRQALAMAMKPTLVKGNSLIQVVYRADTPALAEVCVTAVVNQLVKTQAAIAAPVIRTLEEQRDLTKQQLDDAERFQGLIEKRAMQLDPSDAKFSQTMLMLNAALSKREEIAKLRKSYAEQSVQLAEPMTQSARLFEPIYSPDRSVFPKKTLTVCIGLVSGLFMGLLSLFVLRSWQRFRGFNKS